MPKHDIFNVSGQKVGEIELNDSIFAAEVNEAVLHEVVKNYLANQRQGTHAAKTRSEVRGGGSGSEAYGVQGREPWTLEHRAREPGQARPAEVRGFAAPD